MIVKTERFGDLEVNESDIITMVEGIVGFEDVKRYVLLERENSIFHWLQAVDRPDLAFVVVRPEEIRVDYKLEMTQTAIDKLELKSLADAACFAIVVIPSNKPEEMRANFKAPVVINVKNKKADQVLALGEEYQMRHYIMDELKRSAEIMGKRTSVPV
ncbi:MAG: flagellar assembly protein FliW [bacterium]